MSFSNKEKYTKFSKLLNRFNIENNWLIFTTKWRDEIVLAYKIILSMWCGIK